MYDDNSDGCPSPALHNPTAREVEHFLWLLSNLFAIASPDEIGRFYAMNGLPPAPVEQPERTFTSPAPDAPVRLLGSIEAVRTAFPGVAAAPALFLQNVHSIVLMAALEVVWRANESGALEQAIAFGTWFREIV